MFQLRISPKAERQIKRLKKEYQVEIIEILEEIREDLFLNFWRSILLSGHVTHIFMTPRWEKSVGAQDEHQTAKDKGLKMYYVEEGQEKIKLIPSIK